ncbi:MAG: T9SS type A sorting domain-containing protein [Prolixibacteraceae bacterium]
MKHYFFALFMLFVGTFSFAQDIGSTAADFTLKTSEDQEFTLSDHQGKVIAVFLLGYNCSSCKGIAPNVQSKLTDRFQSNEDFLMIGIDTWDGSTAQVQNFKTTTKLTFDILQKGSQVAQSWGTSYDRIVIIDRDGKLAFKGDGLISTHLDQAITALQTTLQETTTSIESLNANDFKLKLYPNPVVDVLSLKFVLNEAENITTNIYDITGKLLIQVPSNDYPVGENELSINTRQLNKGLHFMSIQIGRRMITQKFTVL